VQFLPLQLPFKPSAPYLGRFFHGNYFRTAIRARKAFFAIVEHIIPACLASHFIVPFFASFVFFVANFTQGRS
jgi:hypothetical protein